MAKVVITEDMSLQKVGCCAYCDDPPKETKSVPVRCVCASDHSPVYRILRRLTHDPRILGQVFPLVLFAAFIASVIVLAMLFPVLGDLPEWAFYLIVLPVVLLMRPVRHALRIPWVDETIGLPLCSSHLKTTNQAAGEILKWPACLCVTALAGAVVIYVGGVMTSRIDVLDGIAILGITAMLIFPLGLVGLIYVSFARSRYGIRLSDQGIELWHCTEEFRDAVEQQRATL